MKTAGEANRAPIASFWRGWCRCPGRRLLHPTSSWAFGSRREKAGKLAKGGSCAFSGLYIHEISPSQRRSDRIAEGLCDRGGSQLSIRRAGKVDPGGDHGAAVGIELDVGWVRQPAGAKCDPRDGGAWFRCRSARRRTGGRRAGSRRAASPLTGQAKGRRGRGEKAGNRAGIHCAAAACRVWSKQKPGCGPSDSAGWLEDAGKWPMQTEPGLSATLPQVSVFSISFSTFMRKMAGLPMRSLTNRIFWLSGVKMGETMATSEALCSQRENSRRLIRSRMRM